MNVFGIGLPEMVLIMVLALLIFGPKKLPEIGRSVGKAIRGFQDASKEFENEFKREAERLEQTMAEPMKASFEPPAALTPADAQTSADAQAAAEVEHEVATVSDSSQEVSSERS
jgi:sec-independent protein translocase protein TatA